MGKSKEELLSEEVRTAADLTVKVQQWGVTLMVTLQTSPFFVRRDIVQGLVVSKKLKEGAELPWHRYLIGTVFLVIVAYILSRFNQRMAAQYRHYKQQLIEARDSGITDLPIVRTSRLVTWLYFIFPMIDVVFRAYRMYVEVKFD
jgi:hypothetical protein